MSSFVYKPGVAARLQSSVQRYLHEVYCHCSTQRAIKLSACKEPFDVDGLVTGADKLLSSAATARVDSDLHQTA